MEFWLQIKHFIDSQGVQARLRSGEAFHSLAGPGHRSLRRNRQDGEAGKGQYEGGAEKHMDAVYWCKYTAFWRSFAIFAPRFVHETLPYA